MTLPADLIVDIERKGRRGSAGGMVWRAWGSGRPLVLLHGASGSWTHWIRNVLPLAARFEVIAPDVPGFGDSESVPEPHTAETLADLVADGFSAALSRGEPFDLAGFSFGGIIGGLVAARLGHRVRTLVLAGAGGLGLPGATLSPLARVPDGAPANEIRETHRENLRRLMLADPRAADDLAVHLHIENVRRARFKSGSIPASDVLVRALPAIRARIAGIWGARDAFVAPDINARRQCLASVQPGLDFRVIPGAGHWSIYEAAEEVNAALLDMLG